MKYSESSRQTARKSVLLAAICAALPIANAAAQSTPDQSLTPVVVTGSRFPNDPAFSIIGATVISAEDIRNAGVDNVNAAIRKIGGVYSRQSLNGSNDHPLDLRGFGANSSQNLVILLDGVRLSENELTTALLSSIPIDSVERIEIVRGGSSVLYGDGATGGTIQIITKRPTPGAVHGAIVGEAGSFGLRGGRASASKGWDGFALNAAYSKERADNYRHNNGADQENFSSTAQWFSDAGRFGLRLDMARANYGMAGALSMAQFHADPRQTTSPRASGAYDSDRITAFFERKLGAVELATELSHREKMSRYSFDGVAITEMRSRTTQFSPRLRHVVENGMVKNELVVGADISEWQIGNINGTADAAQRARAVYLRNEVQLDKNARIALGARHEQFDKSSRAAGYDRSQGVNAWDLQASYAVLPAVRLFAKTGQSYRLPTADENAFIALAPGQILKPQISHDLEFGSTWRATASSATLKWFRHRLTDEIYYDPTQGMWGANANLDPTKRQGVELEVDARLTSAVTLKANFQHVQATFREGKNAGKELALVPRNTASARLNWHEGQHTVNAGMTWVDAQRYGNDFANTCHARMPSFTIYDARYAVRVSAWEFALTGTNLTDKRYYSQAFGCASGIYPDSARAVKFTARYDF